MKNYELTPNIHHYLAIEMNMQTWNLLSKEDRNGQDNHRMMAFAFASHYHWYRSPSWQPENAQRGEWLISHVFAVLGKGEKALEHAEKCLELTEEHKFEDFDLAYAFEAMARAYKILDDKAKHQEYYQLAEEAGNKIVQEQDRKIFFDDLKGYK